MARSIIDNSNQFLGLFAGMDVMLSSLAEEEALVRLSHFFAPLKSIFVHGYVSARITF